MNRAALPLRRPSSSSTARGRRRCPGARARMKASSEHCWSGRLEEAHQRKFRAGVLVRGRGVVCSSDQAESL
eukprot:4600227-Pyramimonas_sp.AAC.1